jgi:hypothetical protein
MGTWSYAKFKMDAIKIRTHVRNDVLKNDCTKFLKYSFQNDYLPFLKIVQKEGYIPIYPLPTTSRWG